MTISLGVSTALTATGIGTTVTKTLNGTTAGRALFMTVTWYMSASGTAPDITSITCSGESNFTLVGSPVAVTRTGPNTMKVHAAVLGPLTSGGSKTITVTFASAVTQSFIWVQELDGANTAALVNDEDIAAATSTNPSVPLVTTVDNCAVFAVHSGRNAPAPTAGAGFTLVDLPDAYIDVAEYDVDVGAAGSVSAAFVNGTSVEWIAKAVAIAPAPVPNFYDAAFTLPGLLVSAGDGGAVFALPGLLVESHGAWAASFTLPGFSATAAGTDGGGVGAAAFSLPLLTVAAAAFGDSAAAFSLPALQAVAYGAGVSAFALPLVSVSAAGLEGEIGVSAPQMPVMSLSAAGSTGGVSAFAGALPTLTVDARGATAAAFDLPALSVDAVGVTGRAGDAAFALPLMFVTADGITEHEWNAAFTLPILQTSGSSFGAGRADAAFLLPALRVSTAGSSGEIATAVFTLPALELLSTGFMQGSASAVLALPLLRVESSGFRALVEAYRTWCLNTRKLALTEYDNFPFNSYTTFNGRVLACGSGGVVDLGAQAVDGAAPITAIARTGQADFGDSHHKRVPRIYTNGSASGDLHFSSITVEGGMRTYALLHNGITGTTQRRVPVGKGPRSRYFQYELRNIDGADFSLASIQVYPTLTTRRVA